jgi:DNA primase
MPKSWFLYGEEKVSKGTGPVLICEGVTDVWRAGHDAVAVMGHHVAAEQRKLLRKHFGDRPLVLMLDPDVAEETELQAELLREALGLSLRGRHPRSRVVIASLPGERDPGDCTEEEIWEAARKALAKGKKRSQQS